MTKENQVSQDSLAMQSAFRLYVQPYPEHVKTRNVQHLIATVIIFNMRKCIFYLHFLQPKTLQFWITKYSGNNKCTMDWWITVHRPCNLLQLTLYSNCLLFIITENTVSTGEAAKEPIRHAIFLIHHPLTHNQVQKHVQAYKYKQW